MPHIHEKMDFTVSTYVVNGDAVLLRHHEKYATWFPVGGHIELDEDPNQAAVREALEESGLHVSLVGDKSQSFEEQYFKTLIPPRFMNVHEVSGGIGHWHVDLVYFAKSESRTLAPREDEKPAELRWLTRHGLSEMKAELRDRVFFYALTALEEVGKTK